MNLPITSWVCAMTLAAPPTTFPSPQELDVNWLHGDVAAAWDRGTIWAFAFESEQSALMNSGKFRSDIALRQLQQSFGNRGRLIELRFQGQPALSRDLNSPLVIWGVAKCDRQKFAQWFDQAQTGGPSVVFLDASGTVAWSGLLGTDAQAVAAALAAGTFDRAAFSAMQKRADELWKQVNETSRHGDIEARDASLRAIELEVPHHRAAVALRRLEHTVYVRRDSVAAATLAAEIIEKHPRDYEVLCGLDLPLSSACVDAVVDGKDVAQLRAVRVAAAEAALAATDDKDADAAEHAAKLHFEHGNFDRAIQRQALAVSLASELEAARLARTLAHYQDRRASNHEQGQPSSILPPTRK